MVIVTADALAAQFPRAPPAEIEGKPTFESLLPLVIVLFENARSVPCIQGGARGYLGLIQDAATYNALPGANPWVDPVNPPAAPNLQALANATQREEALEQHRRDITEFHTTAAMNQALKKTIIDTVAPEYLAAISDPMYGFAEVSARDMLQHLQATYGQVKPKHLEDNRAKLLFKWDPSHPIEELWTNAAHCQAFQCRHTNPVAPFSDTVLIERTIASIKLSGVMADDIRRWELLPAAQRTTFDQLKTHFNEAHASYLDNVTTGQAGYHGVHGA